MPSVTVVSLTTDDRAAFFRDLKVRQIPQFTYRPDEWLVIRGSEDVGVKRQRALEMAKGDIIVHLDDDDWHHPTRIEKQVAVLLGMPQSISGKGAKGLLVGTHRFYVHDLRSGDTHKCNSWDVGAACMPAGSMAYWRKPALEIGFKPGECAELEFQKGFGELAFDMSDPALYVLQRHTRNLSGESWCLGSYPSKIFDHELDTVLGPTWRPHATFLRDHPPLV